MFGYTVLSHPAGLNMALMNKVIYLSSGDYSGDFSKYVCSLGLNFSLDINNLSISHYLGSPLG